VLKQREDEIDHLEEALKLALPHKTSSASLRSDAGRDNTSLTVSGSDERRSLSRASTQQPSATTDEQVQNRRMDDLLK
jgi:LPS O-antigen subunit length determinant protein (WzzB/FepE family)